MNFLPAIWEGGAARVGDRSLAVALAEPPATGTAVQLGLRPEHLVLAADAEEVDLTGTVELSEYLDGTQYIYLSLPDGAALTAEYRGSEFLEPGDTVAISAPGDAARVFGTGGERIRCPPGWHYIWRPPAASARSLGSGCRSTTCGSSVAGTSLKWTSVDFR